MLGVPHNLGEDVADVTLAHGYVVMVRARLRHQLPLEGAFVELGGAQCGICTPGMLLTALGLPDHPTLQDVRERLAGNLCRCTGYGAIYRSVHAALGASPEAEDAR